ncbi:MAG: EamA family transporter [Nanoarchaeota archaeon]|nr:EamA family transporter [Nanoarchaeota archaeon]
MSLAFLAAIVYGVYYGLLKRNLNRQFIWSYYALFFTVLFAVLVPFHDKVVMPSSGLQWALILFEVALLSLFFIFTSLAYKHLESSEVSPLGNLGLVLFVFVGVVFFGESLSFMQVLGVVLMMVGAFVLEVGVRVSRIKKVFASARHRKYLYYLLLAIVFSVFTGILEKILVDPSSIGLSLDPLSPFSFNFITRGLLMIFFLSRAFFKQEFFSGMDHVIRSVGWWVLLAAVLYNVANILYYAALASGQISLVVPITSLSTLVVVVIGGSLMHEHNVKQKMIACAVMVFAAFLLVV